MIRIGKPVQLYEWGAGTNTTNQVWILAGTGALESGPKIKAGVTEVKVKLNGSLNKTNSKDDSIKIMQQGEGMTSASQKWGEVGIGRLKSVEGNDVIIEIKTAIKIGKGTG